MPLACAEGMLVPSLGAYCILPLIVLGRLKKRNELLIIHSEDSWEACRKEAKKPRARDIVLTGFVLQSCCCYQGNQNKQQCSVGTVHPGAKQKRCQGSCAKGKWRFNYLLPLLATKWRLLWETSSSEMAAQKCLF